MNDSCVLRLEEVTEVDGLRGLAPEWSELCERSSSVTPFQSPEWAIPWWERLGGGELLTLALRADGELCAVAPLFVYKNKTGKDGRVLAFIGSGISDYLGFAALPGMEERATDAFLRHIASRKGLWDVCMFEEVADSSPLSLAAQDASMRYEKSEQDACPVIELPGNFEEFLSRLAIGYRIRVKRSKKAFEKAGDMRVELAGPGTLDEFLDDFFELHTARWVSEGGMGVLFDPNVREFHRKAAAGFLKKGWLRLYRLRLNGWTAAVIYGFAKGGRFYSYLGGFLPRLSKYSPGRVLMAEAIKDSINAGLKEFDFLRGREDYKYLWGAKDRINMRITCYGE